MLLQQQQALKLKKGVSSSKDTEVLDATNLSTKNQSSTADIFNKIDIEEDAECQTGSKDSETLANRIELKCQTNLTLDQLKEKSKDTVVSENFSILITNKEVFSLLSGTQKKTDLRLRNLRKNIQKAIFYCPSTSHRQFATREMRNKSL